MCLVTTQNILVNAEKEPNSNRMDVCTIYLQKQNVKFM